MIEQSKGIEMTAYRDLKAKIRALQVQAELARKNEVQRVIEEIQKVIAEFDLKPGDLFADIQRKTRRVRRRAPALAKYRDPASGAVWSGRGRTPRWIAGQDREKFLIHTLA
ncbi:H-NS histone family protein [Burkholderia ubonensis]|uniref:H-NS histone family protein n=1 Tax=Burkholderia ubonensis TaxID=101571 RepID=UPI002FCA8F3D